MHHNMLHSMLDSIIWPQTDVYTNFLDNEDEATHIIYPPCDPLDEEYARPTMKRDRMVLLHWYYFPDSHDTWTSMELPVDPPDSPVPHTGVWRVSSCQHCR